MYNNSSNGKSSTCNSRWIIPCCRVNLLNYIHMQLCVQTFFESFLLIGSEAPNVLGSCICNSTGESSEEEDADAEEEEEEEEEEATRESYEESDGASAAPTRRPSKGVYFSLNMNEEACLLLRVTYGYHNTHQGGSPPTLPYVQIE